MQKAKALMQNRKVCIVIPCYNESSRLQYQTLLNYLHANRDSFILFVNDGSLDDTLMLLRKLELEADGRASVLSLAENRGKAEAVRQGFLEAYKEKDFSFIGFVDADLSAPLHEINNVLSLMENSPDLKLVIGSRSVPGASHGGRNVLVRLGGYLFAWLVSRKLENRFYDTQCGFKLFRRELVPDCFRNEFISRWIFDVEILARLHKTRGKETCRKMIFEYPLSSWSRSVGTRISMQKKIFAISTLFRIFR